MSDRLPELAGLPYVLGDAVASVGLGGRGSL
jgi:hypothetical protein